MGTEEATHPQENHQEFTSLIPKFTIYYKMRSSDSPVEPDREWKGRVIRSFPQTACSIAGVKVESLEEGHEGETELVMLSQVVRVAAP